MKVSKGGICFEALHVSLVQMPNGVSLNDFKYVENIIDATHLLVIGFNPDHIAVIRICDIQQLLNKGN